jgi:histidinol-phosphate/aromatic aminotransferase/cobyric acid decarboxylase-like protein
MGMLICPLLAAAQLVVTVSPPKIAEQKAVVELKMKNSFAVNVESARAICFLLDDQGKMVGESTKWVIGGTKNRPALESKKETSFNFVITSNQPFVTTNLTAKVSFSRVVLEGEKLADPKTDVLIQNTQ